MRVSMWHSHLDARLATRSGAFNYPAGRMPNLRCAAMNALLGERSSRLSTLILGAMSSLPRGQIVPMAKTR
jgi:hypothetical protein